MIGLSAVGAAAIVVFFVFSHAVPKTNFDHVTEGMTEAEVRDLLGAPDRVRQDVSSTTAYFYGGFLRAKWCTMEVFFAPSGLVTGKFHDH